METDYLDELCPNCGTPTVRADTAQADGATTLDGRAVKQGQKIMVCDSCSAILSAGSGKRTTKRTTSSKRKTSARKSSARKTSARKSSTRKTTTRGGNDGNRKAESRR